jgi:cytochrome c oxidase assembly protein subunit 15
MTLAEFKVIYWWEWGRRFLGRFVGLVWAVGLVLGLVLRLIPRGWLGPLVLVGALGGLQGAIGWWMVSSGLTGRMVDVASYRLAIHLGLAFGIFALLTWYALRVRPLQWQSLQARRRRETRVMAASGVVLVVMFAQILLGALVAGLDAGRAYVDWPTMGGAFFPMEALNLTPVWVNFFENEAMTQFNHRILGYLALVLVVVFWGLSRSSPLTHVRRAVDWVAVVVVAQVVMGIVTVVNAAPLHLAIVHQALALAIILLLVRARYRAAYPEEERIAVA